MDDINVIDELDLILDSLIALETIALESPDFSANNIGSLLRMINPQLKAQITALNRPSYSSLSVVS